MTKEELARRSRKNLDRVRALLILYRANTRPGHQPVGRGDLLRAAVVFLHATLEDILRGVVRLSAHRLEAAQLDKIPLAGTVGRTEKFSLGKLTGHRGKTVDQLLVESVEEDLRRSNYNRPDEVLAVLDACRIPHPSTDVLDQIGPMMARRHQIVHQADQNDRVGAGHHQQTPISVGRVEGWADAVEQFREQVVDILPIADLL